MSLKEKELYEFGQFRLDVAEHFLLRSGSGERVPLSEKAFETLCVLVRNAGHLVNKTDLINQVWADSFVEENNLSKCIHAIRRALGEKSGEQRFIETVKKHGFRFVAEVRRLPSEETAADQRENGSRSTTNGNSSAEFSPSAKQTEPQRSGTVVALADWRRETDDGKAAESEISPSLKRTVTLEPVPAKSTREIEVLPKDRRPLFAFALAAFLIGAGVLGYYFYGGHKISSANGKRSIAVLPLKPINAGARNELYELGITDSLIFKLGSMKGFVVRPLSATRKYGDIEQDPLAAGKEQQVDYVLAANYQLANGKIRITAQLFNVATGQIEETYKSEKDSSDIFAAQDAIAGEVGNILSARFEATENTPAAKFGTTNEEAYLLYLQGRNLTYNQNAANTQKAIEYLGQAIRLDPNFALAYSAMAHAYIASGNLSGGSRVEYEKAKQAVTKALELDNNLAEGHAVSGQFKFAIEWDYAAGEKDLLRAIELAPNSDFAHQQYASYLAACGRFDEALAESKTALEINPNSYNIQLDRARILYLARRYDEAILQYKRVVEVHHDLGVYGGWLWVSYEMKGDYEQAYEWFMKTQNRTNPELAPLYQKTYETSGWQGVRQKILELQMINEQTRSTNYYGLARQCAILGKKEQAFEYLNKAIENRQGQLQMLKVEPPFDSLRDDPRFAELVRRVGL